MQTTDIYLVHGWLITWLVDYCLQTWLVDYMVVLLLAVEMMMKSELICISSIFTFGSNTQLKVV